MQKKELKTPTILLNIEALKNNIKKYQKLCTEYKKELWPMIKTHKSMEIVEMQIKEGSTGVLCGTLDEAEACCQKGVKRIMYAYPVASEENINRIVKMSKKTNFIIRLDSLESAIKINKIAETENIIINYTIIVDSGLHRFGVSLKNLLAFAEEMKKLKHLKLEGISSHPGHVYSSTCEADIHQYVLDECETLRKAKELLEKEGCHLKYITSGSTPTFEEAVKDSNINVYHPGNYVFLDSIQLSINKAKIKDCALTVLATIISHPSENLFICDAGAKCVGLDQGAHGNSSIIGYGTVINHPEIIVFSLSEEVGKLKIEGQTNLKVGDKIEIIPNHSCSTANLCSYYTVTEGDNVIKSIKVDVRGNSIKRI